MTARLLVLSALCAVADGEAIRQDCGTVAVSTDAVALILRGEAFRGLPGVEAQIADPVVRTHVDGRLLRQALGCTGRRSPCSSPSRRRTPLEGAEAALAEARRAGRGYRSAVALRLDAAVFAPVAAPEDPSADAAPVDFLSFDVEEARGGDAGAAVPWRHACALRDVAALLETHHPRTCWRRGGPCEAALGRAGVPVRRSFACDPEGPSAGAFSERGSPLLAAWLREAPKRRAPRACPAPARVAAANETAACAALRDYDGRGRVDLSVGAQQARETALIRCDPNGAARILVLQEARDLDRDLWAMYRPVRETLTRGLDARAAACGYTVRALSGYRAAKKELRRGDTAIFIGVLWPGEEKEAQLQRLLSRPCALAALRRGLRAPRLRVCVHYVTEPKGRDAHDKSKRPPPGIRELWTYTRAHDWARYAPPGYAPVDDKVDDRVRASRGVAVARFLWLGTAWGKPRRACWDALATKNPKTRGRAESRRDVWPRRLSALLSLGAVVVSEPALAADRAEFAGMLLEEADFCDGRGWTEATKERLFDGGAALRGGGGEARGLQGQVRPAPSCGARGRPQASFWRPAPPPPRRREV
ncbi:hypothetical protein JL721_2918 [Aureococcus anophagefferens]|nr:hypothetical protein JL721_2918 [Aureococcus anophagefferens]